LLVIRRRVGERFLIGDHVEVEVLEIAGTRVKLGIVAPESIPIIRKEAQATREQNLAAARHADEAAVLSLLQNIAPIHSDRPSST
jgi:carbon storage regulator